MLRGPVIAQGSNQVLRARVDPSMTLDTQATPFGCCNFFDRCTDELMSLHFGGRLSLLDYFGWNVSDECYKSMEYINWVRPEFTAQGAATEGAIANPCNSAYSYEFGTCKLTVENFGRIGRSGPVRDMMHPKYYCKTDPIRRLDGRAVTDEREWDMAFAMQTMQQDLYRYVVIGNHANAGEFDGLNVWVNNGYECDMLNSIIIDWGGLPMTDSSAATWNGVAIGAGFTFLDVLLAVYRRIRQRISWAPLLSTQQPRLGDMTLVMPTDASECLLNNFTCWNVCPGSMYNFTFLNTYEGRQFRDRLDGGLFGGGQIALRGFPIPIFPYDWETIAGPKTFNAYLLTGSWGSQDIWMGEHLSATQAAQRFGNSGYYSTDGGRVLGWTETENECSKEEMRIHPRLFCKAPFTQARFLNIQCNQPGGFLSPDPLDTSFFPETSFAPAVCS